MIEALLCSLLLWLAPTLASAAEGAPAPAVLESAQPQSVNQPAAMEDEDVYYAPEESGEASGEMGASQGAVGSLAGSASYLSHAKIVPFEWGHPETPLGEVELFLNNQYLGKSPLGLENYLVQRVQLTLSARKEGFEDAERVKVNVPVEGDLRVALLNNNAAAWYTTPAWVVGLGLVVGAVGVYSGGSKSFGLGLAAGGLGVITISQLGARFMYMPALRREVDAYNQQSASTP